MKRSTTLTLALAMTMASAAGLAVGPIVETPVPGAPRGFTNDAFGDLWVVTDASMLNLTHPYQWFNDATALRDMTVGPDQRLWAVDPVQSIVWRYDPADGTGQFFPTTSPGSHPASITVGPDGNLWFTEPGVNKIGRITRSGLMTEFAIPTADSSPHGIVSWRGSLWFAETTANKLRAIETNGTFIYPEVSLPTADSSPIALAPLNALTLAVAEQKGNKIALLSLPDEVQTIWAERTIPTPASSPVDLIVGPDHNLWFLEFAGNKVGVYDVHSQTFKEYDIPTAGSKPHGLAVGREGDVWFSETIGNKVGRISLRSLPGDANGDGSVDVSDVFYMINFLFAGGAAPK